MCVCVKVCIKGKWENDFEDYVFVVFKITRTKTKVEKSVKY